MFNGNTDVFHTLDDIQKWQMKRTCWLDGIDGSWLRQRVPMDIFHHNYHELESEFRTFVGSLKLNLVSVEIGRKIPKAIGACLVDIIPEETVDMVDSIDIRSWSVKSTHYLSLEEGRKAAHLAVAMFCQSGSSMYASSANWNRLHDPVITQHPYKVVPVGSMNPYNDA